VRCRKASYTEALQHIQWLLTQKDVDWSTLDYPTREIAAVEVDGKVVVYGHYHGVLVIESLAFNPDADAKDRLESVMVLVENICQRAKELGFREIWYMSSDTRTDESAARQLGFEKKVCLRKRL